MRGPEFVPPRDGAIRIWRRLAEPGEDVHVLFSRAAAWHVSLGAESPMQRLRLAAEVQDNGDHLGMAWDEALEAIVVALACPGAIGPRLIHLEPPVGGGWELVVEIQPVGRGEFHLLARAACWDRLCLGEALAVLVHLTFDTEWRPFASHPQSSFALAPLSVAGVGEQPRGSHATAKAE